MNISIKEEVMNMIKTLPDECSYDDIMAEIYFKQKIDQGLKDIEEGKVISHEDAKKRLNKWIKEEKLSGQNWV